MKLTPSQRKTVRHQFDSFYKKISREESRTYKKEQMCLSEKEVSLSELPEEQLANLYTVDQYPSELYHFSAQSYDIEIENSRLASALADLPAEKLDIVLLAYFLDMSDQEIAEITDSARYTVQRRRTSSLKEVKSRLEVKGDGNKKL